MVQENQSWSTDRLKIPFGKVSFVLIVISIICYLMYLTEQGRIWLSLLMITNYRYHFLIEVSQGHIWKLLTPIFLHFSFFHILFNMLWLRILGSMIEQSLGSWRFILMVLFLAIPSNVAQYALSGPHFGGMSGVIYGLFAFIWMTKMFNPSFPYQIPRSDIIIMLVWYFACLFKLIGSIANMAHGVGLVLGMIIGLFPYLFTRPLRSKAWRYLGLAIILMLITLAFEFTNMKETVTIF